MERLSPSITCVEINNEDGTRGLDCICASSHGKSSTEDDDVIEQEQVNYMVAVIIDEMKSNCACSHPS